MRLFCSPQCSQGKSHMLFAPSWRAKSLAFWKTWRTFHSVCWHFTVRVQSPFQWCEYMMLGYETLKCFEKAVHVANAAVHVASGACCKCCGATSVETWLESGMKTQIRTVDNNKSNDLGRKTPGKVMDFPKSLLLLLSTVLIDFFMPLSTDAWKCDFFCSSNVVRTCHQTICRNGETTLY